MANEIDCNEAVALIVPCLDRKIGWEAAITAMANAGHPVFPIVQWDQDRKGYVHTVNQAVQRILRRDAGEACPPRHICLLDSNATPKTDGWLAKLVETLYIADDIWFVGGKGNCRTSWQKAKGPTNDPPKRARHLASFCLLLHCEVATRFEPLLYPEFKQYGADVLLQMVSTKFFGKKTYIVPEVYIEHLVYGRYESWWRHDQGLLKKMRLWKQYQLQDWIKGA